jgi:hypothetical protein
MRILTIHPTTSGASRLIPLYVLQKRYISRLESTKNSFLVPKRYHKNLKDSGIDVLDVDNSIDYEKARKSFVSRDNLNSKDLEDVQIKLKTTIYDAIEVLKPDLIIEDFEAYTVLPCKKFNIPRVSIHRTGQFRSIPNHLRNSNHFHSCEKSVFDSKKYDASLILVSKAFQKRENITLEEIMNYNFRFEFGNNILYVTGGVICKMVYDKCGENGIWKLLDTDKDTFKPVLEQLFEMPYDQVEQKLINYIKNYSTK